MSDSLVRSIDGTIHGSAAKSVEVVRDAHGTIALHFMAVPMTQVEVLTEQQVHHLLKALQEVVA